MSPLILMLTAGAGIALLLFLVLKYKFQPFVALMLVSIVVALVAGVKPADLVATIEGGMGKTLGHIAIIIALGAMIGRIIELSGGAEALAKSLIERFGNSRTPLALTIAGFIIGVPVFFEVGVIILMPLAYGVARRARKPLLVFALPMCAALLTVHAFLPPHPGAVAAASQLGADLGRVLMFGLPITALLCYVGYRVAARMTRRFYPMTDDIRAEVYGPHVTNEDLRAWTSGSNQAAQQNAVAESHMGLEESTSAIAAKLPAARAGVRADRQPDPAADCVDSTGHPGYIIASDRVDVARRDDRAWRTIGGAVDRHLAVCLAAGLASGLEPQPGVGCHRLRLAGRGHGDPDRRRWRGVRQSVGGHRDRRSRVRYVAHHRSAGVGPGLPVDHAAARGAGFYDRGPGDYRRNHQPADCHPQPHA